MRRYTKSILTTVLISLMVLFSVPRAHAGIYEIIKAATVKVIKAIDLRIQRLQNKTIWLQNAQKELENQMSKLKLNEISEWSEKQRKQYDEYFKELWRVKNALATYNKVKNIVARQLQLLEEYKRAWGLLQQDKNFTARELAEMYRVYSGMLDESLKHLEELMLVANSLRTQMSDGERMELISKVDSDMDNTLTELRSFSDRNFRISVSRARDQVSAQHLKAMYGLK
ncbi:MAG: conjugal transfer protein TraI [Bacteroidetes bacterium 43-16]|uniref:hypothetical protein n=1 Tax=uncultured Dysgonomonas sp. TaxID=206096 RepID=UPI00092984EF|nr:hypothetical protein [uncultured Dysgonomonas sp.]OJV52276.1 MAG: conjugal transfer protein TraI [Bacteroidetes bacterium 43-16]